MIKINRPRFHILGRNKLESEVYSDDHKYDKEIESVAKEYGATKIRLVTSYNDDLPRKKIIIHDIVFDSIKDKELFESKILRIGEESKKEK